MENIDINDSTGLKVKSKPRLIEPYLSLNDSRFSRLSRQVSTNSDSSIQIHNEPESPKDELYRVLYDYYPNHDDELPLKKNSIIKLLSKDVKISGDDGWWTGISLENSRRGIFPSNYVEPCQNSSTTNVTKSSRDLPPQIAFSSLKIQECIGAGGFGKVYRGYWLHENDMPELVAIKEARIEGDKEDLLNSIKQNVINEAKLFWILRHPNIIQLKAACFQEPHFCLVMEYAKGGSLGRLLAVRKIGFPPNILIHWALQVSQGMHYLHEQALPNKIPIIHRDLKSSNILLSEDAVNGEHRLKDIVLKLTDFGLARQLEKTTNEMSQAGTYSHMPPEVIKSSTYSKASDVWSFGVLLWELLTGEVPYKGIDPLAIAYGVAVNKLTLPIPTSCPKILSDLINGCWHTDPHKRLTFEKIIDLLTEISKSTFASTSNELFWTMQQDWKFEIQEMFDQIKVRENELRTREQEIERISIQQQAYENMLRQRERELEAREKDLALRELTVALQQLTNSGNAPPPEPKKRRKGLLNNLLRSSNNSNTNLSNTQQINKSFEISSPSDFHHCLSVQPDVLLTNHSNSNLNFLSASSSPKPSTTSSPTHEDLLIPVANSNHLIINSSPNLRLKIMLPQDSYHEKRPGLVHQKTLSPNRSREKLHATGKSSSVDVANENLIKSNKIPKNNKIHASRSKNHKVNNEEISIRSNSNDPNAEPTQSTKKISKILYEIGSILSFVGLGKDLKSQQHTRRSHEKKSDMLTPSPTQSHSLTRFHKTYPYRFKSLTCQSTSGQSRLAPEPVIVPSDTVGLSSSSSNLLLSPTGYKQTNQEMLKKYSKSVDCPHYQNSTDAGVQRQQSVNCSPLIPRRSDYEPIARVTIQRQQRVEQSPSRLNNYLSVDMSDDHIARPLTLDLKKTAFLNGRNLTLSTASTNDDDFLNVEHEKLKEKSVNMPKPPQNRDSLSLSISSITSSSQPSSISPVASPRLGPRQTLKQINSQQTIDETLLTPNYQK